MKRAPQILGTAARIVATLFAGAIALYALAYLVRREQMFPPPLVASFRARPWGIYPHALFGSIALVLGSVLHREWMLRSFALIFVRRRELSCTYEPYCVSPGRVSLLLFSLEEDRMHVHVDSPEGEIKVWLEPTIEVAQNHGIPSREVTKILRIVEERRGEIEERWLDHHRR